MSLTVTRDDRQVSIASILNYHVGVAFGADALSGVTDDGQPKLVCPRR